MRRLVFFQLLLLFLLALEIGLFFSYYLHLPLKVKAPLVFTFKPGSSVRQMVGALRHENLVTPIQAALFRRWIQLKGVQKQLHAGEYALSFTTTPLRLLDKMVKGEVVQYALTLAEGSHFEQALALLRDHPGVRSVLQDTQTILDLWQVPYAEGFLFPDTYYFPRGTTDIDLLNRAHQMMQYHLEATWQQRDQNVFITTPYEALILASIIEKEAANPKERALISGVLQKRLANNMRLQVDPTVVYGLGQALKGPLTREHLKQPHPYNTYLNKGLPPSPIALPSLSSLYAACHPLWGEWLYFVSKGDGTHHFSVSLSDHNQAVARYQQREAK